MARPSKHIQALDHRIRINLADLKRDGYLAQAHRLGTLAWRYASGQQVRVRLAVDLDFDEEDQPQPTGQIELRYESHTGPVRQIVSLTRLDSNLGLSGGVWYFLCPKTGDRCRTLYWDHQGFVSRRAIAGALYHSQQRSKSERAFSGR